MKLIDGEALAVIVEHLPKEVYTKDEVFDLIMRQKIAYDIDAVVEQLRNSDPQEMMTEVQKNVLNYCIDIVKAGGKHE